jgi:hypothetical protein
VARAARVPVRRPARLRPACPLYDHCPRWHGQPDDRLASITETMAETERRQAAWPCSALLDLLTPDLTRIGP